jgi:hypothetical protein
VSTTFPTEVLELAQAAEPNNVAMMDEADTVELTAAPTDNAE